MAQPNLPNIANAFQTLANEIPNVQNLPIVAITTQLQALTTQLNTTTTTITTQIQTLTTQIQTLNNSIDQRMYNIFDFQYK